VYRAGRVAAVPGQLGLRFPGELLQTYISRPRAHVTAYRVKAELSLTFDARPWLGSLGCPTFVLVGSWDPVVPASAGRELARSLPNAVLHRLRGGHLVHLVHAPAVAQLIATWAQHVR
jgi:pimeloyl-ACP methyl ester carboxylesterase